MPLLRKIISPEWEYGNKLLYVLLLISISLIAYYHLSIGFVTSPDFKDYARSSENLINLDFNFYKYYLYSKKEYTLSIFYTIPVILLAILKIIFGTAWLNSFMYLNLFLIFFSLILFTKILILLKIRPLVISLSIPLITLSVDVLVWPRYILSDTIFAFEIIFIIYLITKNLVKKRFDFFSIIFFILLMLITRPTSLPFIFSIFLFIIILKYKINFSPKFIFLIILSIFILIPFAYAILFQFMEIYLRSMPKALFLIEMVESGMIIHDRPETWINKPNNFFNYAYLYFLRILFFFNPYADSFSIIHIILNLFQTIIIIFSITYWLYLNQKNNLINQIILLILLLSIFVSAFHAFILIDYDWRYRFPLIMPLLIIFPISIELLFKKNNI